MNPHRVRILVVDDEPDLLNSVGLALRGAGYETLVESDLRFGLHAVEAERPDLVVADLDLAHREGFAFLDAVRGQPWPPPVVVVSSGSCPDGAIEAMRRGAIDVLPRPLDPDELRLRVARALEWGRLAEENRELRARAGLHRT